MSAGICANRELLNAVSLQGWLQPCSTTSLCLISFNYLYEVRETLIVCPPQNHPPALKYNKKQLCDEAPCGIGGVIYFWNSHNNTKWALMRRHMAPKLFPLVNKNVYIVLA